MRIFIVFPALLLGFGHCSMAQTGFIRAQGKQIAGADGRPLTLRGISLGNWLLPEGYMFGFDHGPSSAREIDVLFRDLLGPDVTERFWREWRDTYISQGDIELIRKAGFNSVRIPLHHALFVEDGAGFVTLDRVVRWCKDAGLAVILDLHAAPGGQTGSNIDDSWGYPWLFESPQAQEETIALWRRLALRYRDEPAVLGYDLLNEPIPQFPYLQKYNAALEPLYKRIVAAIREVDRNHIVILGGAQWDTNFKVFGAPFDANAMYTFHKYWMEPTRAAIEEYLDFRERYNVPVWLGESGENTDEWVARFRSVLEENQVGWCFWPYKKMDKTGSVVTFAKPIYWDELVAYAKLPGGVGELDKRPQARPSVEHAQAALADLLKQIRFENRRVNLGFLKALGMRP